MSGQVDGAEARAEDVPAPGRTIQQITGIDFIDRREREKQVAERFATDTAAHVTEIVRDDDRYRHLKVHNPDTSAYWYEVVTWPGSLAIRGDIGTFVFARTPDMFQFFRRDGGGIQSAYWAEKEISGGKVRAYSDDAFRALVAGQLAEWIQDLEDEGATAADIAELAKAARDEVIADGGYEVGARRAISRFEHEGHVFSDTWEWDLTEYTHQFLWCLHAIVHAIAEYDRLTTKVEEAP